MEDQRIYGYACVFSWSTDRGGNRAPSRPSDGCGAAGYAQKLWLQGS